MSEDVKSPEYSEIENIICCRPNGSLISTTDESSEVSVSTCDDNSSSLPPTVDETVVNTSDENKLVTSPAEIRKNVPKKSLKDLIQTIPPRENFALPIDLDQNDSIPYGTAAPYVDQDFLSNRVLGEGASGKVFDYIDEKIGLHMAIKYMTMTNDEEFQIGKHEVETNKKISNNERNQYIVEYYDEVMTHRGDYVTLHICMEYMDTSVTAFYKQLHKEARLDPAKRNTIIHRLTQNLASALFFLEKNDIVHRDIKPDNMLVNKKGQFKLCDLGLCTSLTELRKKGKHVVGSVLYKPPQPAEDPIHDDMWRFGVSLLEICNGEHPYAKHYEDSVNGICALEKEWKPIFNPGTSSTMKTIISKLLEKEPSHRFNSFGDILEMEDFRKFNRSPSERERLIIGGIIDS